MNINSIEKIAQGIFILATRVQHPYWKQMTSLKTWILQMYVHKYAECKNHYHVSLTVFLAKNLAISVIASLYSDKKPHATNGVKSYKTFSWNEVWFLWFSNIILHRRYIVMWFHMNYTYSIYTMFIRVL